MKRGIRRYRSKLIGLEIFAAFILLFCSVPATIHADGLGDLLSALSGTSVSSAPAQAAQTTAGTTTAETATSTESAPSIVSGPCMTSYHLVGQQCVSDIFPASATLNQTIPTASTPSAPNGNTSTEANAEILVLQQQVVALQTELSNLIASKSSVVDTSAVAVTFARPLAIGARGPEVSALQEVLKNEGYFTYPEITGYFGTVTRAALEAFQSAQGIAAVGSIGPKTRAALNLAVAQGNGGSDLASTGTTLTHIEPVTSGTECSECTAGTDINISSSGDSGTESTATGQTSSSGGTSSSGSTGSVGTTGGTSTTGTNSTNTTSDTGSTSQDNTGSTTSGNTATSTNATSTTATSTNATSTPTQVSSAITIAGLSNGSVVSGSVPITAVAPAGIQVAGVSFVLDKTLIGAEDTTAPYSATLVSTSYADGTHTLSAVMRTTDGAISTSTVTITIDNNGPGTPGGLTLGAVDAHQITLSWWADALATYYGIYRNDVATVLATTTATSYTDYSLAPQTTYSYHIVAYDAAGVASPASATVASTTLKAPGTADYIWKPLRIGAGGWIVGMDIASDGTTVVRTDTGAAAYIWNGSEWAELVTSSSMPSNLVAPGGLNVYALRIAPTNTDRLYMARGGYVFRSDNKGATWTQTTYPFSSMPEGSFRMMGSKMAVDPHNENVVYIATPSAGAWKTDDAGITWTQVAAIPAAVDSDGNMPVAFDPSSGTTGGLTNTIYIGSEGHGIYQSTDAGQTWALIPGSATTTDHMIVAPNGVMYYTDHNTVPNNVWKYASGKLTQLPTGGGFFHSIAVDPKNPNRLVIGSDGGGLEQSLDGGATWTSGYPSSRVANDIPWLAWTAEGYMSNGNMMFNPTDGELYFAEGIGVWKTTVPTSPGPIVWTSQSYGIEQLVSNEIIDPPGGEPLVASWDRGVFYSADPDVFPAMHGPNRNTSIRHGWALDWASSDPSTIVGVFNLGVSGGASGYSNDGGQTWRQFATVPNGVDCCGGDIAASTPTNFLWVYSNNGNAYYTKDGGQTWALAAMPGVPTSGESGWGWAYYFDRHIVAADRVLPNTFYAYNYGPTQAPGAAGIFKSTDGGTTWTQVHKGTIGLLTTYHTKLRSVPGEAGNLFFTASLQGLGGTTTAPLCCGFYQSTDGGATWNQIPNVVQVWDVGFGKSATPGGYPAIYIVGWVNRIYGIWRSDDDAKTWVQIGDYPMGNIDLIKDIAGDMNIYGRMYIGFAGSGYAYGDPVNTETGPYTVRVYPNSHGNISPETTAVAAGGSQAFSITPDSGYYIGHVYVDGVDQGAISSYTFSNVNAPHTISVEYDAIVPPNTPSNFSATSASTSVALFWNDVATEDNYVIERSTSVSSGFTPIATTSANITSYTDSGLAAGVYYYRLKATNTGGASAYTAAVPGVACGSCQAPSTGLVGYWPLDGNANDASGNNENGTLVGSTTTFVPGRIGEAASFTGASGNYINMGNILDSLNQSITLSAWVNVAGNPPDGVSGTILGKDSNYQNTRWTLDVNSSNYGSHVYALTSALTPAGYTSKGSVPSNTWTFITYTWDGSTEDIYINGILDSSQPAAGSLTDPNKLPFHIGYAHGDGNGLSYFDGLIDEVRVYDRALSPTEVAQLYGSSAVAGAVSNIPTRANLAAAAEAQPISDMLDKLAEQLHALATWLTSSLSQ